VEASAIDGVAKNGLIPKGPNAACFAPFRTEANKPGDNGWVKKTDVGVARQNREGKTQNCRGGGKSPQESGIVALARPRDGRTGEKRASLAKVRKINIPGNCQGGLKPEEDRGDQRDSKKMPDLKKAN